MSYNGGACVILHLLNLQHSQSTLNSCNKPPYLLVAEFAVGCPSLRQAVSSPPQLLQPAGSPPGETWVG